MDDVTAVYLRSGAYYDSVRLMQVSRTVADTAGVLAAQVAMATELNIEVLTTMGFAIPEGAAANDLVIALRAASTEGLAAGEAAVELALAELRSGPRAGSGGFGSAPAPRTLGAAVKSGEATLALISVPGQHAVTETLDAIEAGVSVMLFSDNVSLEDEIRLKDAAAAAEVLVMGPDCGTALVGGVALGFANVVSAGEVGMVAASGTGAQQVMCLLDAAGVGISHCLGTGGRDLSAAVGGRSTRAALAALADDPNTGRIIVVSKPPDNAVLEEVTAYAAGLGLDVTWAILGPGRQDLTAAVEDFLRHSGIQVPTWPAVRVDEPGRLAAGVEGGGLRGLFCGGTLADEAMLIAQERLGAIYSNIPLRAEWALGPELRSAGHVVIDFGDDGLTQGRAHPMIDPSLRLERIAVEAADPSCGVLLLDLVLGHGAHPDPAVELAEAIGGARARAAGDGRSLPVVGSLTGTDRDPQDAARSTQLLAAAGASVLRSNAEATRLALDLLTGVTP